MFDHKIIAHRGIFDNEKVVENTIPSFQKAILLHLPFELDVQLTKDHQVVVFHDDDLFRLAGIHKKIVDCTYSELKKITLLSTDDYIPLLRDVLKLNHDQVPILIEIKKTNESNEMISLLFQELKDFKNYLIQSFDFRIIRKIKKKYPNVTCGLLLKEKYDSTFLNTFLHSTLILYYSKCDFLSLSKKFLSNHSLKKKYLKYPIYFWTIKKQEEIDDHSSYHYICNSLPYKK